MNRYGLALLALVSLLVPPLSNAHYLDDDLSLGGRSPLLREVISGGENVGKSNPVAKMMVSINSIFDGEDGSRGRMGYCTGTLIAEDLVLTAAHCLFQLETNTLASKVLITDVAAGAEGDIFAETWAVHAGYRNSIDWGFFGLGAAYRPLHDIAIIKLSKPVGEKAMIAHLPAVGLKMGEIKQTIIAGYGRSSEQDPSSVGVLRFAWSTGKAVQASGEQQIHLAGAQICSGDSGGPVFELIGKSELTVIGIHSHGHPTKCAESRATAVHPYLDWIVKTAKELRSTLKI